MHHPEISSIVQIIDDYFLLQSPDSSCTIKGRKIDFGHEDSVIIRRDLNNGYLEVEIKGENEDDDDLDIVYYRKNSQEQWDKRLKISSSDFSFGNVRKAIRDIVIFDSKPSKTTLNTSSDPKWLDD